VGHDKVKLERYTLPGDFDAGRRYEHVSDTVASARLDSIVAALTGISREKAQSAVKSGIVCLNYIENTDCDSDVSDEDIISVRGFGKYKIEEVNTKTRKNRLRLSALKYI
jgi:RNA-binding protein YlmH